MQWRNHTASLGDASPRLLAAGCNRGPCAYPSRWTSGRGAVDVDASVPGSCQGRFEFTRGDLPQGAQVQGDTGGECATEQSPSACGDYNLACTVEQDSPTDHARLYFPMEDALAIEASFFLMLEETPTGYLTFLRVLSGETHIGEAFALAPSGDGQMNRLGVYQTTSDSEDLGAELFGPGQWYDLRLQDVLGRVGGVRLLSGDNVVAALDGTELDGSRIDGVEIGIAEMGPVVEAAHMHIDGIRMRAFDPGDFRSE